VKGRPSGPHLFGDLKRTPDDWKGRFLTAKKQSEAVQSCERERCGAQFLIGGGWFFVAYPGGYSV